MCVPDRLSDMSRSQVDFLFCRFGEGEIIAANGEGVAARAFSGDSQDQSTLTHSLNRDFEIEDVVTTQINGIESSRQGQ
jgi:hypothetical protein